jgi:hypothetical protein
LLPFLACFFARLKPVALHVALHAVRLQAVAFTDGRVKAEELAQRGAVKEIDARDDLRRGLRGFREIVSAGIGMEDFIDES